MHLRRSLAGVALLGAFAAMAFAGAATGAPAAPQAASAASATGTKLQAQRVGTGVMAAQAPRAVERNPYKAVLQSAAKASLMANSANRVVTKLQKPAALSYQAAPQALNKAASASAAQGMAISQRANSAAATGVNAWQQETYGGYNLEPPDPTLCASPSFVVQVVNNQIQISDANLNHLTAPISNESFFGDFTNFIFDPACTYNHSTGRWYYTLAVSDFATFSGVYIAVSTQSDPRGPWNLYFLDVGNFGGDGACAAGLCLADQPLLGSDQYTLAVSTNQFDLDGNCATGFCGAAYVLIDKAALALGLPFPNAVAFDLADPFWDISPDFDFGNCVFAFGPCWYSVQPADSGNGRYDTRNFGTQWAMSALEFFGIGDNRIAVWQFTNTSQIGAFIPVIGASLSIKHFPTGIYINPPDAAQPQNPTSPIQLNGNPLGDFLVLVGLCPPGTAPAGCSNPGRIQTEDDRMKDTVVTKQTNGATVMWGALTSDVGGRAGIMVFGVNLASSAAGSSLVKHYIIHNSGADLYFPAVASFDDGLATVAYTVSASNLYASSAFSVFSTSLAPQGIGIANLGHGVQDGFTQYPAVFGGRARWGDYAGAATALNRIYFTSEFIPDANCSLAQFLNDDTCGVSAMVPNARKRTFFANWGTSLNRFDHP